MTQHSTAWRTPFIVVAASLAIGADTPASTSRLDTLPAVVGGIQFGPEQIFEGEYITNFEASVFVPKLTPQDAWCLNNWKDRPGDTGGSSRTYEVKFVGRRTVKAGGYCNMSAYPHMVMITRLIDARQKP